MKSTTFAIASLLASVAVAQPHGHQHQAKHVKRDDVVWVTDWVTSTEIVGYTTTIWVEAGQAPPTAKAPVPTTTAAAPPVAPSAANKEGGQFREKPAPSPSVAPVAPVPVAVVPAPVPEKQPPPPPPPAKPTTTTLVPVVVPTTVVPPVVAPTAVAPPVVAPPVVAPVAPIPSTSPSAPSTGEFTGAEVTFYDTGMGSCGEVSTDADLIVALSHIQFDKIPTANPNLHPYCRKFINISYKTKSVKVKVIDKCMGCKVNDLDLSPAGFKALGAEQAEGRLEGASWSWA